MFPTTSEEMTSLGIEQFDIILISGEAYLDHPSSGVSVLAHLLRSKGYSVGILDQPDISSCEDFKRLGKARLFFGISSGTIDSMLSNYTATKKRRHDDRTSVNYKLPDRAVIVYCNRLKEAYKDVPVVIGGVEASLRRLSHYDYWSDSVRRSILLDAKADILVYGMGERQILEIAERITSGQDMYNIKGTVIRLKKNVPMPDNYITLPSFEEVSSDMDKFSSSFMMQSCENDPFRGSILLEEYGNTKVIHYPPPLPLTTEEMDFLYELPYERQSHGKYNIPVKGLEPVLFSVITHRGCFGGCSFCSLGFHQGRIIQSRSIGSILREVEKLSKDPRFKGYIYDLGGPSANMYCMNCKKYLKGKEFIECKSIRDGKVISFHFDSNVTCSRTCLPGPCKNMECNTGELKKLLRSVRKINGIKKVFIRSGIRYDLALLDRDYLYELVAHHISGQLKVAPEHIDPSVLKLMNKPSAELFDTFCRVYKEINIKVSKKQFLVPYLIAAHPGAGKREGRRLKDYLKENHLPVEQVQIFTPIPMTRSTCMYWTGKDPVTMEKVFVVKDIWEKEKQKQMLLKG